MANCTNGFPLLKTLQIIFSPLTLKTSPDTTVDGTEEFLKILLGKLNLKLFFVHTGTQLPVSAVCQQWLDLNSKITYDLTFFLRSQAKNVYFNSAKNAAHGQSKLSLMIKELYGLLSLGLPLDSLVLTLLEFLSVADPIPDASFVAVLLKSL